MNISKDLIKKHLFILKWDHGWVRCTVTEDPHMVCYWWDLVEGPSKPIDPWAYIRWRSDIDKIIIPGDREVRNLNN